MLNLRKNRRLLKQQLPLLKKLSMMLSPNVREYLLRRKPFRMLSELSRSNSLLTSSRLSKLRLEQRKLKNLLPIQGRLQRQPRPRQKLTSLPLRRSKESISKSSRLRELLLRPSKRLNSRKKRKPSKLTPRHRN